MKHLIFLVPNLKETCDIAKELEQVGVRGRDLHVYSNTPEALKEAHIHPLNAVQMTNLALLVGRALVLGTLFTVAIASLFLIQLPSSMQIHPMGYVAMVVFGLGFGFWVSGMIGLHTLKEFMTKYENYIREGHYLMMVDALDKRERELKDLILSHHQNVHFSDNSQH